MTFFVDFFSIFIAKNLKGGFKGRDLLLLAQLSLDSFATPWTSSQEAHLSRESPGKNT